MQIPSATYRVQFHHGFTFRDLTEHINYLEDLGITAVYASPIFAAAKGSQHGYDGIDPRRLNPEIGTMKELITLSSGLRAKGIGWIQDIVPNHLAFHTDNPWLYDVFDRGISSSYAHYFDIDWDHPFYTDKLIAPVLGNELDQCIAQQEIKLRFSSSGFSLIYADYIFPVRIEDYPVLLDGCLTEKEMPIIKALNELIGQTACSYNDWISKKSELLQLLDHSGIHTDIQARLQQVSTNTDLFAELIKQQHYVLCKFSVADQQINYRRFFNINALISLRMDDDQVFNDCHQFVYELYRQDIITGLRIDHIDGLKDPGGYIDRLRQLFGNDCYIIVEKILDIKEQLPPMDIQGTSGYEFLSYTNQLITDTQGADKLISIYQQYVTHENEYERIVYNNKLENLKNSLNGDWDNLLRMILSLQLIKEQEIGLHQLKSALGALMAAYPVYRSYDRQFPLSIESQQQLDEAVTTAMKYEPALEKELSVLTKLFKPAADATETGRHLAVIQRIMQFTGPMAAKGVEDTTFYQYNALISHNEVGDAPCVLGISVKAFHEKMQQRQQFNACSMNSTSTHDTKRGEDARMRINLLSELTGDWSDLVWTCRKLAGSIRPQPDDKPAPSLNDEYFLFQTIIGSLPDDLTVTDDYINRLKEYFIKALRESKLNSNHVSPNDAYEKSCLAFIDQLLDQEGEFLPAFTGFIKKLLPYSRIYSLAQLIIKLTAPGIPDIYRGCELWDYSFVDPDNRRPVDYSIRRKLLDQVMKHNDIPMPHSSDVMSAEHQLGIHKLWITWKLLQLRKKRYPLFAKGEYIPVYSSKNERNLVAYMRRHENEWLLIALPLGIVSGDHLSLDLVLPEGSPSKWRNILTDEEFDAAAMTTSDLFKKYPVAVLRAG